MDRVWGWLRENEIRLVAALILLESLALLTFSLTPSAPLLDTPFRTGDLEHLLAYLVYGGLLAWVSHCRGRGLWAVLVLGSLFGLLNESLQFFVPGRFLDPLDWIVDTIGTGLGALIVTRFKLRWFEKVI